MIAATPEARIPDVAERLVRLWTEATGDPGPLTRAGLRLALMQSWLESGVAMAGGGGWWKKAMVGSGNLGAIQCTKSDPGGATYYCAIYTDKHSDGTEYSVSFRYYQDGAGHNAGDNAAIDFLKHIAAPKTFLRDPNAQQSGDVIKSGGTIEDYCKALYNQHYYEGSGSTDAARIQSYITAMSLHADAVDAALDAIYGPGGDPGGSSGGSSGGDNGGGDSGGGPTPGAPSSTGGVSVLAPILITASSFALMYAALSSFSDNPFDRIQRAIAERSFLR